MTGMLHTQFLGALFDSDTIWILIPLTALMIPIIAILIHHQQRMAQIIHGRSSNPELENEVHALRREVQELKQMMSRQAPTFEMPESVGDPIPPPVGFRPQATYTDR